MGQHIAQALWRAVGLCLPSLRISPLTVTLKQGAILSCTEEEATWRSSVSLHVMQGVLGLGVGKAAELGDSVKKAYAQV